MPICVYRRGGTKMYSNMLFFIIIAFLFMVFSMVGWVLELLFRRFISMKKWINPGFLRGPYLPIYGTGVVCLFVFVHIMKLFFESYFPSKWLFDIVIAIGIGALMTLIELVGGLIFIRGMKVRLWDYSTRWGNYKGIICPLFSLIWTVAGGLFYFFLFDPINSLVNKFIQLHWLIIAVFLMGMFYGIFAIDLIDSIQLIKKVEKFAKEIHSIISYDMLKAQIKEELKRERIKTNLLAPFSSPHSIFDHLKSYSESDELKSFEARLAERRARRKRRSEK